MSFSGELVDDEGLERVKKSCCDVAEKLFIAVRSCGPRASVGSATVAMAVQCSKKRIRAAQHRISTRAYIHRDMDTKKKKESTITILDKCDVSTVVMLAPLTSPPLTSFPRRASTPRGQDSLSSYSSSFLAHRFPEDRNRSRDSQAR
jgi:hypothetical protein